MKKLITLSLAFALAVASLIPFSAFAASDTAGTANSVTAGLTVKVYDSTGETELTSYTPGQTVKVKVLKNFTGFTSSDALQTYQINMADSAGKYTFSGLGTRATVDNKSANNPNTLFWGNTSYAINTSQTQYGYVASPTTGSPRAEFKVVFLSTFPTMANFTPSVLATFDAVIDDNATGDISFDVYAHATVSASTFFGKTTGVTLVANRYKWSSTSATLTKKVALSDVAELDTLTVNDIGVTVADNMSYSVASSVSTATIDAIAKSSGKVTVDGPATLSFGDNTYTITVKSQDDANTKTYTLVVNRPKAKPTATVSYAGKAVIGSKYHVELGTDYTDSTKFKAYALDAVYGWVLVQPYSTATSFDITVENPSDPLQIEVLASDSSLGRNTTISTPTASYSLKALGQIGIVADSDAITPLTTFTVGSSINFTAKPSFNSNVTGTVNYEISFGDSKTVKKGIATDDSAITTSAIATVPGTYKVTLYLYADGNKDNYLVKYYSYTVTDTTVAKNLPQFSDRFNISNGRVAGASFSFTPPLASGTGNTYKYRFVAPVAGGSSYSFNGPSANVTKPGIYYAYADVYSGSVLADTAYTTVKFGRSNLKTVSINEFTSSDATYESGIAYTFTVTANNNTGNETQYMFIRRDEYGYRTVQAWSTISTWTWTPARDGIYEIYAYVKASDAGSYEAVKSITANVGGVEADAPTFSVDKTIAGINSKITVTNAVAGNVYAFEIYDPFSNKYINSGYSESTSYTFVPTKARDLKITVYTKTLNNSGAYDAKSIPQTFTYTNEVIG